MPTYSFRDLETLEEWDKLMPMAAKETYLADNKNIKQIHTGSGFLGISDPVRLGRKKPDNGFRDVLSKVKEAHPGSRHIKNTINEF